MERRTRLQFSRTSAGTVAVCADPGADGRCWGYGLAWRGVGGRGWEVGVADSDGDSEGIGLAKAIEMIRGDLLAARKEGENADIRLPVASVTVELQVVATSGTEGKAGFRVPFVDVELGGSLSRQAEQTSTVTVVFGAPVDRAGNPVQVAEGSDELLG